MANAAEKQYKKSRPEQEIQHFRRCIGVDNETKASKASGKKASKRNSGSTPNALKAATSRNT